MADENKNFTDTGASLLAKARIAPILAEIIAAGYHPKIAADAAMGAALDVIGDRDGLTGQMVYLRTVADQIEAALSAGSTHPN